MSFLQFVVNRKIEMIMVIEFRGVLRRALMDSFRMFLMILMLDLFEKEVLIYHLNQGMIYVNLLKLNFSTNFQLFCQNIVYVFIFAFNLVLEDVLFCIRKSQTIYHF